jgi:hypothetical protein
VDACQAPVIAVDISDVEEQAISSQPQSPSQQQSQSREESTSKPDTAAAQSQQDIAPASSQPIKGPPMPEAPAAEAQHNAWRQPAETAEGTVPPNAAKHAVVADHVPVDAKWRQPGRSKAVEGGGDVVRNWTDARDDAQWSTAVPEEDTQLNVDSEPAVYASVEEMEEAERNSQDVGGDQEPIRLLSEAETDASLIHSDYTTLPVVFAPMLFRANGANRNGSASFGSVESDDTEKMLFTVDTTIDETDPDIVALVFEDPVDATALLSMLAHVRGFRDPDKVARRVVPMPADIAQAVATEQGASVLCMAKGFQKKAEVRAGKEIDGLLSRIAGARWASLINAQVVS